MKPATKGFILGVIAGGILTLVVEFAGLIGLGMLMSSGVGRSWIADRVLRPPRFPQTIDVSQLVRANCKWTLRTLEGQPVSFTKFRGRRCS